ncbi:MAG: polysaccharide deacetylase family protein [Candidatus Poribacteria bacterium]|nr:polysaccharide deacetylase family protein [Candidatus Poribacteria bacterium]MDE0505846.1 polysaccharide deacetylase family protein [Candidatus Poribacteria bacterium]
MSHSNSSPWSDDRQAAVSLTFDDGSASHLDIAMPILEEYNLLGTFYINPRGDDWEQRYLPWRNAALAGHEIGNHTIQHICTRNFGWNTDKCLENVSLEYIEADVLEAERRLNTLIPEQQIRTFCYPCYQSYVGEGINRQSYVPMIAKHFPAARGLGEAANHPLLTDLHYLTSSVVAGWMSGSDLRSLVDSGTDGGRWLILTLHGLQTEPKREGTFTPLFHGEALPADSFRELCKHLAERGTEIWTAPVVTVAQKIIEWRERITG